MNATANVYEIITARIIELLEKNTVPWRKPWRSVAPANLVSKKPYRGINAFLLNALSFESPYFLTFKQAKQLGGSVRKGEKGTPVVFWQFLDKEKEEGKKVPLLRYYTVFNVSQCENITAPAALPTVDFSDLGTCENIVGGMPNRPEIQHGGNAAAYFPVADKIAMPPRSAFQSGAEYYSTLFHELVHSTGHVSRLARKGVTESGVHFGSETYSGEELVAEMGASFLCGHAGIETATIENSAAYLRGWLCKLRNDKKLIILAAGQAQKAADYILGTAAWSE